MQKYWPSLPRHSTMSLLEPIIGSVFGTAIPVIVLDLLNDLLIN